MLCEIGALADENGERVNIIDVPYPSLAVSMRSLYKVFKRKFSFKFSRHFLASVGGSLLCVLR